jgi:hypothetical protein
MSGRVGVESVGWGVERGLEAERGLGVERGKLKVREAA